MRNTHEQLHVSSEVRTECQSITSQFMSERKLARFCEKSTISGDSEYFGNGPKKI